MKNIVLLEKIENKIFWIRGKKVMIDADLAQLYKVQTYRLNEAIKRNIKRFPVDFMLLIFNSFRHSTGTIRPKLLRYALEIGRWALVAYLLFPLRRRMHLPLEFARTALGIVLFVIFPARCSTIASFGSN